MNSFSHLDEQGRVRMVDVSPKKATLRTATASGQVVMESATLEKIIHQKIQKGNVLETARIAGVMAAKKTADLIPMCHPLNLTHVQIDFYPDRAGHLIEIVATVRLVGRTGVEMEALTAVAVAALTLYDMCKSHDREMVITAVQLREKAGGKSGHYVRPGA